MLDYIQPDLIAEVLADEWVLSVKNPGCFVNALYDALCDCLEDDTVEQYIRYGMGIETPEETLERLEEDGIVHMNVESELLELGYKKGNYNWE